MQGSILDHVGRTPLVPLRRLGAGLLPTICVKLESLNPGGSIKDRVAIAMIDEAERQGWLRPGGTIIEATAGNTGVGLALCKRLVEAADGEIWVESQVGAGATFFVRLKEAMA